MTLLGWLFIVILFMIGMLGAVIPMLPGALFLLLGFLAYGWWFDFSHLPWWFWAVQIILVLIITCSDLIGSALGTRFGGGSRSGMIGCVTGFFVGLIVLPGLGILLGPLLGAFLGELYSGKTPEKAMRAGFGAAIGFLSGMITKVILQVVMICYFFVTLWITVS